MELLRKRNFADKGLAELFFLSFFFTCGFFGDKIKKEQIKSKKAEKFISMQIMNIWHQRKKNTRIAHPLEQNKMPNVEQKTSHILAKVFLST